MKHNDNNTQETIFHKARKNALILRIGEVLSDNLFVLVKWNFYFFITCLPIVTIGPAMAALSHCTNLLAKDDRVVYTATKNYFDCFRQSVKKTMGFGIAFVAANAVFVSGLLVYVKMMADNMMYIPMVSASLLALAIIWAVTMHTLPLVWEEDDSITDKSFKELVKTAAVTALTRIKGTVTAVAVNALTLLLTAAYFPATLPVVLTVTFVIPAMTAAFAHTDPQSFN
ncbi:MAG: DUF624 domain-containing protein [Oscillospiraceae bacterium]|nr:DUF624 domain-containing protein [Oscillospiraceae bacterium]